jgi:hypothetical protein
MKLLDLYDLIKSGWIQGPYAVNSDGQSVNPRSVTAVKWCLWGGCMRIEAGLSEEQSWQTIHSPLIDKLHPIYDDPVEFSEGHGRTQEEVLDFIERAAKFEILICIRDKISIGYTDLFAAADNLGKQCDPDSPDACKWCLYGALYTNPEYRVGEGVGSRVANLLRQMIPDGYYSTVDFNMRNTQAQVLEWIDSKIKELRLANTSPPQQSSLG